MDWSLDSLMDWLDESHTGVPQVGHPCCFWHVFYQNSKLCGLLLHVSEAGDQT